VVLAVFALKSEASKMSHDQIAAVKKNIYAAAQGRSHREVARARSQTAESSFSRKL